ETNPLRMLRSGVNIVPKMRGNRPHFNRPQTASLARLTANVSRSQLPAPPPIPIANETDNQSVDTNNPLPLPPRDRNRAFVQPLKQHERRHPLLINSTNDTTANETTNGTNGDSMIPANPN